VKSAPWFKPSGVLDPDRHSQFIANRVNIAKDAGIPEQLLWKPLPVLTEGEKDWMKRFRKHRDDGTAGCS
jgi:hypothetical protein